MTAVDAGDRHGEPDAATAGRIAASGQARLHRRLHVALTRRAQIEGVELSPTDAERLVAQAARAAGPQLWRLALAEAASSELGLSMAEALALPELELAARFAGAPEGAAAPRVDAIRVAATHLEGLEAVRAGERDLELRLSAAGIDVLVGSSGAPIGRLAWEHVRDVALERRRRALRGGLRLHVDTDQGRASFELPRADERELRAALDPLLDRALRPGGR